MPKLLNHRQARQAATGLAALRAAIGAAAYVLPKQLLRPWIGGDESSRSGSLLLGRALGGRDLALAAGPLLAMRHDAPARGWIEAGLLADVGDSVATILQWRKLPTTTRWLVLAMTLGAVAAGAVIAPSVDGGADPSASRLREGEAARVPGGEVAR